MIKSVSNHSQPSGPSYTPAPAFLLKSKNSPLFNTLWAHYPMTYSASDTPFASIPLLNRSNAPRSKQKIKPSVAAKPPPFPVRTLSDRLPIVVRNERLNFDSRNTPVATMHRKDKRRKQRKIQLCNKYLATVQHYSLDSMSNSYSINDNTPNISNEHLLLPLSHPRQLYCNDEDSFQFQFFEMPHIPPTIDYHQTQPVDANGSIRRRFGVPADSHLRSEYDSQRGLGRTHTEQISPSLAIREDRKRLDLPFTHNQSSDTTRDVEGGSCDGMSVTAGSDISTTVPQDSSNVHSFGISHHLVEEGPFTGLIKKGVLDNVGDHQEIERNEFCDSTSVAELSRTLRVGDEMKLFDGSLIRFNRRGGKDEKVRLSLYGENIRSDSLHDKLNQSKNDMVSYLSCDSYSLSNPMEESERSDQPTNDLCVNSDGKGLRSCLSPRLQILSDELMRRLSLAKRRGVEWSSMRVHHDQLSRTIRAPSPREEPSLNKKLTLSKNGEGPRSTTPSEPHRLHHSGNKCQGSINFSHQWQEGPISYSSSPIEHICHHHIESPINKESFSNKFWCDGDPSSEFFNGVIKPECQIALPLMFQSSIVPKLPYISSHSTVDSLGSVLIAEGGCNDHSRSPKYRGHTPKPSVKTLEVSSATSRSFGATPDRAYRSLSRDTSPGFRDSNIKECNINNIGGGSQQEANKHNQHYKRESVNGTCTLSTDNFPSPFPGSNFNSQQGQTQVCSCGQPSNGDPPRSTTQRSETNINPVPNINGNGSENSNKSDDGLGDNQSASPSGTPPSPSGTHTPPSDDSSSTTRLSFIRCDLVWPGTRSKSPVAPVVDCMLHPIVVVKDHVANRLVDLSIVTPTESSLSDEPMNESVNVATKLLSLSGIPFDVHPVSSRRQFVPRGPLADTKTGLRRARGYQKPEPCSSSEELQKSVRYRWYRGRSRAICTFHPHKLAILQCTVTLRCFCNQDCFARGHQQLHRFYMSQGREQIPKHPNPNSYGVPCRPFRWDDLDANRATDTLHYCLLHESGLLVDPATEEEWELVSTTQGYVPTADDIGRQLRLECYLETNATINRSFDRTTGRRQSSSLPGKQLVGARRCDDIRVQKHHSAQDLTPLRSNSLSRDPIPQLGSNHELIERSISMNDAKEITSRESDGEQIEWPSKNSPLRNDPNRFVSITTGCVLQRLPNGKLPPFWHAKVSPASSSTSFELKSWKESRSHSVATSMYGIDTQEVKHRDSEYERLSRYGLHLKNNTQLKPFSVMSWNVLAEIYATQEQFPYCESYALAWCYRRGRILETILEANADIVCLQEVQNEYFTGFFLPALREHGYDGVYKRKTNEIFSGVCSHSVGGKFTMDGCATFYKVQRFRVVDNCALEFSSVIQEAVKQTFLSFSAADSRATAPFVRRLLRDNIALILLLEDLEGQPLLPDPGDIESVINHFRGLGGGNSSGSVVDGRANPGISQNGRLIPTLNYDGAATQRDFHQYPHSIDVTKVSAPQGPITSTRYIGEHLTPVSSSGFSDSSGVMTSNLECFQNPSGIMRRQLIIANTHIVANPEANDAKIWQTQMLVSVIERYLRQYLKESRQNYINIVIQQAFSYLGATDLSHPLRNRNNDKSINELSRRHQQATWSSIPQDSLGHDGVSPGFPVAGTSFRSKSSIQQSHFDKRDSSLHLIGRTHEDVYGTDASTSASGAYNGFPSSAGLFNGINNNPSVMTLVMSGDRYDLNDPSIHRSFCRSSEISSIKPQQVHPGFTSTPYSVDSEFFYSSGKDPFYPTGSQYGEAPTEASLSSLSPYAPVFQSCNATAASSLLPEINDTTYTHTDVSPRPSLLKLPHQWKPGLCIAGDFNSTPTSAVYQLLSRGSCARRHPDLATDRYDLLSRVIHLGHSLSLKSSHSEASRLRGLMPPGLSVIEDRLTGEPAFTNYTANYVGCLDYIFFGDDSLEFSGYRPPWTDDALKRESHLHQFPSCFLPSPIRPSDHLPLQVEFRWKQ